MYKPLRELTDVEVAQGYYAHGEWHGHQQFHCALCPFDSLHSSVTMHHVASRHPATKAVEPATTVALDVVLYDSSGRVITEREVTDAEVNDPAGASTR